MVLWRPLRPSRRQALPQARTRQAIPADSRVHRDRGVRGATALEIGGGIGEIQLELLKRGAARTINLELSPAYDQLALHLVREAGVEDRVERRLHDIAVDPAGVQAVDIVVLNRVVCCYPDYERLLSAAADHARRLLVFSYPPGNRLWRAIATAQNAAFRLLRKQFRAFAHPPDAMLAVLARHGLRQTFTHRGTPFSVAGLEREHAAALHADTHPRAAAVHARHATDDAISHEHAAKRMIAAEPW